MTTETNSTPPSLLWHTLSLSDVLQRLTVDPSQGLSSEEAQNRWQTFGPNELEERGGISPWRILLEQFTETMVIVLIVAAIVSGFIGDFKDAIAILVIVILNGILGFTQEYRAEQAMAALKKMAAPHVKVRRGGAVHQVEAPAIVPGDIILLETGDAVPADAYLIESANLRVEEASLTGESTAVDKVVDAKVDADAPLGDRHGHPYHLPYRAYLEHRNERHGDADPLCCCHRPWAEPAAAGRACSDCGFVCVHAAGCNPAERDCFRLRVRDHPADVKGRIRLEHYRRGVDGSCYLYVGVADVRRCSGCDPKLGERSTQVA